MTQNIISSETEQQPSLLDRPLTSLIRLDWEVAAWIVLLLIAIVTRFYDVGVRAMSHDESLHALYSYYLYDAGNYEHNPMMHGPFLFHFNVIFYFLFGVTDATARMGPVLAGLGVLWMAWLFRTYIGRTGVLVAGILILISPSLLFHSRYIRNDIYIVLFTMIWIYGAFRYLDTRETRWLTVMTLGMAFGFVTKENHFMTGAIIGAYFAGLAVWQLVFQGGGWQKLRNNPVADLAMLMLTLIIPFTAPFPFYAVGWEQPNWQAPAGIASEAITRYTIIEAVTIIASVAIALFWFGMRRTESSDSEATDGTSKPPLLTFSGWAILMGIFWIIEILFFTTFLTNTRNGLATGIIGSLGYWIGQQEVARGSQPWYYYIMLGWLYEFLPAILSLSGITALVYKLAGNLRWDPVPTHDLPSEPQAIAQEHDSQPEESDLRRTNRIYFATFSIWWIVGSWIAYTAAGEKMPWLFTHITLPMCILGGWWFGSFLQRLDWAKARQKQAIWLIGMTPALIFTLSLLFGSMPFAGRSLGAVASTSQWILALLMTAGLGYITWHWWQNIGWKLALRLLSIGLVALLFLLTVRFSYMLNYINFDYATEYLVYAHASPDIKRALSEIDLISERTVGGRNIEVAYDDDSSWPLSWYMRLYPNTKFYGANPSSDAMDSPVIIVGSKNYDKVRPYVVRDYVKRVYRQVWWPDQGYFNLTWNDVWNNITDSAKRKRLFQIIFYRRFPDDNDPSRWRDLTQWPNRHEFEMYVRRDIAAQVWDLGIKPELQSPDNIFLPPPVEHVAFAVYNAVYDGQSLLTPRALAIGPNSSVVVADTGNHRLVVLDSAGNYLRTIGSHCNLGEGAASGCVDPDGSGPLELGDGQLNEPWGVAVDGVGHIYVADTWNGRVQVFDAEGKFLRKWGQFNSTNGELGDAFVMFGPRGLAVDSGGNLLVADTGNKRILQFTPEGEFVHQVGGGGVIGGRFEEPTGLAIDPNDGSIYVADAWNQRIQKLDPSLEFVAEWVVPSWESQDIYHKPYVAVASNGDVYASDPELYQVFVYDAATGKPKASFGNFGTEMNHFSKPLGLAVDLANNTLLVADSDNNRLLVFEALE